MFGAFTVDDPNSTFNSARVDPEFGLEFKTVASSWTTVKHLIGQSVE